MSYTSRLLSDNVNILVNFIYKQKTVFFMRKFYASYDILEMYG